MTWTLTSFLLFWLITPPQWIQCKNQDGTNVYTFSFNLSGFPKIWHLSIRDDIHFMQWTYFVSLSKTFKSWMYISWNRNKSCIPDLAPYSFNSGILEQWKHHFHPSMTEVAQILNDSLNSTLPSLVTLPFSHLYTVHQRSPTLSLQTTCYRDMEKKNAFLCIDLKFVLFWKFLPDAGFPPDFLPVMSARLDIPGN